jgi:NitT/TauT family transport system ATP-binding protein
VRHADGLGVTPVLTPEVATSRAPTVVELRELSKTYRARGSKEQIRAIESVTLDVISGEFLSIVGPSGCGKSTLLKIIAGLTSPSSGHVRLDRQWSTRGNPIGMVFQSPVLLPWRSILDNVLLPADIARQRNQYEKRAKKLVEMVGLEGFERRYPFELSGGMQQRVSLARALLMDPAVLLMDEPFGALDAMTREQMGAELQRIWQETRKTILFVTHSIPEAVFLSDRVAVMTSRPGRIARVSDIDLPRPRTTATMGAPEFTVAANAIRGAAFAPKPL